MTDFETKNSELILKLSESTRDLALKMSDNMKWKPYQKIYDIMIENGAFKRHRVLFIRTGFHKSADDIYFFPFYNLMKNTASKVKVIYNTLSESTLRYGRIEKNLRDFQEVGSSIPRQICGFFRSPLYITRSLYTTYQAIKEAKQFQPTIIIIDASVCAVSFLKHYYPCPVFYMQYYQDVTVHDKISIFHEHTGILKSIMKYFLRNSDEILLPSQAVKLMYFVNFGKVNNGPVVVNPLTDIQIHFGTCHYNIDHKNVSYVFITGVWDPQSNFSHALEIWKLFLLFAKYSRKKYQLIICGYLEEENQKQNIYRQSIIKLIKKQRPRSSIKHFTNISLEHKVDIYRACQVVLNLREQDLFNMSLIEAHYFGIPIVSVRSPFACEIIKHSENGLLVNFDINSIAEAMFSVAVDPRKMSNVCKKYYENKLGPMSTDMRIRKLLKKYLPPLLDAKAAEMEEPRNINWGPLMFYLYQHYPSQYLYLTDPKVPIQLYFLPLLQQHTLIGPKEIKKIVEYEDTKTCWF